MLADDIRAHLLGVATVGDAEIMNREAREEREDVGLEEGDQDLHGR